MAITLKSVTLTLCILVTLLGIVNAATTSLVLYNAQHVIPGQNATYNCSSSGDGADPRIYWTIKDGTTEIANSNGSLLTSRNISGTANPNDGVIRSSVTFLVQTAYTEGLYKLYCNAIDVGSSSIVLNINTPINATSAVLGGTCSSTTTCSTAFSFCDTSQSPRVCRCTSNYYDDNGENVPDGSCDQKASLGEECQAGNDNSCLTANARCSLSSPYECECKTGYVQDGSNCVSQIANLGESCTNPTRNCVTNAACSSGTCQCNSGYIASGNTCVLPTLGQACTSAVGCQSSGSGSGFSATTTPVCSSNVCACPSNYYTLNSICYQKHALGETCTQSVSNSCSDTYSSCTGSSSPTCQCNSGYIESGGSCVLDSSSQSCPSSSTQSVTITGVSSPSSATTPSVWVNRTCYEVNLSATVTMGCKDTKSGSLKSARWLELPDNTQVVASTDQNGGSFINGDKVNPNLTVSNAQGSYAGDYVCQLCYGESYTRCTNSATVKLIVIGSAISSVSISVSPTGNVVKGDTVTLTCNESPSGVADSYLWYKGVNQIGSARTYTIPSASTSSSGDYTCIATNSAGSTTSSVTTIDVQYAPEYSLSGGGSTETIAWNFDNGDLTLTCEMTANPSITKYYFYNSTGSLLNTPSSTNTYTVTSDQGYQTYSCKAENSVGNSSLLYTEVTEDSGTNIGAATEDTGISTGAIAAIVLGIIFFLLLLIIIIVCCCNYGWCRKKEKVEPQPPPPPPAAKPYIPRTIVSANSTVTRKDIGVMINGHHDVSVSTDFEEPRYTTPRYHLKPAKNAGPIISMYDDGYEQPRPHQLPALDTQYLYTDNEPKKRHKKKRKRRHHEHRESSPRRHHYEPEPESEPVNLPPSDEDLVVIPGHGKQNYFE